ncbi:hypothetical protein KR054_008219 [Drosophila jambulina]|nr:hypothetical protein KR054_008219 [Drosophila jambulina]
MTVRDHIRKFCLMNWKNCKLQVGNPLQLLFILLCPPIFICFAVAMRVVVPMEIRTDKIYDPIDLQRCWLEMVEKLEKAREIADRHNVKNNPWTPQLVIGWAPNDYDIFKLMMEAATDELAPMKIVSFSDCDELRKKMKSDSLFAGICMDGKTFKKTIDFNVQLSPIFRYSIIMPSELRQLNGEFRRGNWYTLYPEDPQTIILERLNQPYEGGFVGYVREGFILMQKYISESFLFHISHVELPHIKLRRFPVLGSREDPLMYDLNTGLSLLILVGYLFPSLIFIWQIVREKQTYMRLFMVNMSIGNLFQFLSWYITCLVCFIISSLIVVVLLKVRIHLYLHILYIFYTSLFTVQVPWNFHDAVLTQTPWYHLLLVVVCYCIVAASYVVMVASFFNDPHAAVQVATMIWVAFHMPNFVLWNSMSKAVWAFRYVSYMVPNVVLAAIFECIVDSETIMHSSYDKFKYNHNYRSCPLPVFTGVWIFLVISLVYCGIGLYMDIWRMGERSAKRINREEAKARSAPDDQYKDWSKNVTSQVRGIDVNSTKIYEVEPSNRRFRLKIKKLCKRFGSNDRPALNHFTWNVYENEVTVLMGHNGCGKTTLLKILAGLTEPTRGSITVAGYDMVTERKAACMELGLAISIKMMITELTVLDHLRFICRVKGMHSVLDIDGHIGYYMHALQIDHLKDKRLNKLTPRHLVLVSICCAFMGNSSIILIDDIYSDLDNPTKALIWALINEEKSNRTIIVVVNTTMLAESLSDRLAIMSNGELKCTGTKPFLKNMYGHGFRLICVKGKNCNTSEVVALMNRHLPNLTIESNFGFKINFVLENKDEDQFSELIDDLEVNMERLDVTSFRIRDTSTEEIFLRFGCDEEDQMGGTLGYEDNPNVLIDSYFATLAEVDPNKRKGGCGLYLLHFWAVLYMRLIYDMKKWPIILLAILLFIITALCTFSGAFIYGKRYDLIPYTYNLTNMYNIKVFTELASNDQSSRGTLEYYKESLYWYDVKVTFLDRSDDGSYALTHNSEFSRSVNMVFMFGATLDNNMLTGWFNNIPLHVAPITLNLIHNAIARNTLDEDAIIDVTLETLDFQSNINIFPPGTRDFGVTMASTVSFILCFITPAHTLFIIRERSSYLKKQHFLAGARPLSHWAFTILYDTCSQSLFIVILVVLVGIYHHPAHDLPFYIMLLLAMLMGAVLKTLMNHLVASRVRSPMKGFIIVSSTSCIGFLLFEESSTHNFENLPQWLYLFYQYVSAVLIHKLFINYENQLYCSDPMVRFTSIKVYNCQTNPNCCIKNVYTHDVNGVVWNFVIMWAWIVLIGVLLFISECYNLVGFAKYLPESKKKKRERATDNSEFQRKLSDDPSAYIERQKRADLSPEERSQKTLVAEDLFSQYGKVKVLKGVNLTLSKGECLNVTGLNESGRSTLLKLTVREAKLNSGQIWINGHSVRRYRSRTYRMVGYCPQNDYLQPEFTPRQLLYVQAMYHGHPKPDARKISEALIRMLGLYQCCNRSASVCTTGEERRLYYAFAILCKPDLICVDGVPSGLDPVAKRIVLTVTTLMQTMGSTFLYTSLPVLDTERLCQRRTILFDGALWTVRSQGNDNKPYASGYQLEVRFKRKVNPNLSMSRSTWNRINHFPLSPHRKFSAFMEIKFPDAVLRREDDASMVFHISVESTTFSTILLTMRRDSFEMNIEDYYISRNIRISHFADQ